MKNSEKMAMKKYDEKKLKTATKNYLRAELIFQWKKLQFSYISHSFHHLNSRQQSHYICISVHVTGILAAVISLIYYCCCCCCCLFGRLFFRAHTASVAKMNTTPNASVNASCILLFIWWKLLYILCFVFEWFHSAECHRTLIQMDVEYTRY